MAGTVTYDIRKVGPYQCLEIDWTSDAAGDATGTTTYGVEGAVSHIETVPSATAAPTALYDITLKTIDGRDIAGGNLANRSATAAELISVGEPCIGILSVAVSNAGNAKSGKVRIFFLGSSIVSVGVSAGSVDLSAYAPLAGATFTGSVTVPAAGLLFGDGDSGFTEPTDEQLFYVNGGSQTLKLDANGIRSIYNTGFLLLGKEVASGTNPVILPSGSDVGSGVGYAAASTPNIVANSKSGLEVDGSGTGTITTINYPDAGADTAPVIAKIKHGRTGADGVGGSVGFYADTALDVETLIASLTASWTNEAAGESTLVIGDADFVRINGGFGFGVAPTAVQTGYTTFANLSTDRTCDADTVLVAELADVVGTLIEDLKAKGIISA